MMTRLMTSLMLVAGPVLFGAVSASAQSSPPVRSDQEILIQLEHDWDAAFHRHDAAFIDRILAEEFIVCLLYTSDAADE